MTRIPYERAKTIAAYLDISLEHILSGEEAPSAGADGRRFKEEEILFALSGGGEEEITEAMFEEVKNFARFVAQREAERKKRP